MRKKTTEKPGRTKGTRAVQRLLALLTSGEIVLGDRLSERVLARRLRMSRTPVRQAIHHLTELGLLTPRQGSGTEVQPLVLDEYRQVMEIRAALEGLAARLAAHRIADDTLKELGRLARQLEANSPESKTPHMDQVDLRFHGIIARSSGNVRLCRLLEEQRLVQQCFRLQDKLNRSLRRVVSRGVSHIAIVDALRRRSADDAERVTREHIVGSSGNVLDQWELGTESNGADPAALLKKL